MKMIRIGSVTRALRAKEILEGYNIRANVKKLSDREGCVNALSVPENELSRAFSLLSEKGFKPQMMDY